MFLGRGGGGLVGDILFSLVAPCVILRYSGYLVLLCRNILIMVS